MKNPYVLISPKQLLPRTPHLYSGLTRTEIESVLAPFSGEPTALDFETSGLDPFLPDQFIRCVSLASREACLAIDLKSLDVDALDFFWSWAASHPGFIFHNALFDTVWAEVHGKPLKIQCCTSALFRHLSTEGWVGQSWSLKTAMTDVLEWPEQNTDDLYAWLKANKMGKDQMSWAPWEILGKYAALDAEATYILYQHLQETINTHTMPATVKDNLRNYESQDVINLIELLKEQQIAGMCVDLDLLTSYEDKLEAKIRASREQFFAHESVQGPLIRLKDRQQAELLALQPARLTATGSVAKRWESWQKKCIELEASSIADIFNIDSPQQLAWLFYTELKFPISKETDGGSASVDKKSLPGLGELGKILIEYRKQRDRLKFATALRNVQIKAILHPSIMVSATNTGRCGGGQQG